MSGFVGRPSSLLTFDNQDTRGAGRRSFFSSRLQSAAVATSSEEVEAEAFFEGELVSFTASSSADSNNNVGIAAIKVKDDDSVLLLEATKVVGAEAGQAVADAAAKAKKSSSGGQGDDLIGQAVKFTFPDGTTKTGMVVAQRHPVAFVMCNFDSMSKEGESAATTIEILKTKTNIQVSKDLIGKVVDCFGNDINAGDDSTTTSPPEDSISSPIFSTIPKVADIALINTPMLTGITAIDALTPIGKGQNMLLIGNDIDAQRSVPMDMLTTQVRKGTKCVYACTSSDEATRSSVLSRLDALGLSDNIVTVRTRSTDSSAAAAAAEAVSVASSACTIAETFARKSGDDTMVVVDVLDYHKDLWDHTTRTLVDIYGTDAVVKADMDGGASSEMRGFYSALIQRAGKFNKENGGGSVTLVLMVSVPKEDVSTGSAVVFAPSDFDLTSEKTKIRIDMLVKKNIPLTADNLKKIQIPPPVSSGVKDKFQLAMQHVDDLISMSDGQVWFTDNNNDGNNDRLMLDVQRSITRVGIGADTQSRADAPALQALTGGIRFELAQAFDAIENTGNDFDRKEIQRKNAWLLAMHQDPGHVRTLSEECVALLAVKLGVLDGISEERTVEKMIRHVWEEAGDEMKIIDDTLDFISSEGRSKLEVAIQSYFQ